MGYHISNELSRAYAKHPSHKAVLMCLAHHADDATRRAWPGWDRISEYTGLSKRAVLRSLEMLVVFGLVRKLTDTTARGHRTIYSLSKRAPSQEDVELSYKLHMAGKKGN